MSVFVLEELALKASVDDLQLFASSGGVLWLLYSSEEGTLQW